MKRIGVWVFYAIGAFAILYLALYAYAAFTGRDLRLQPGDPIHIFRKPDAPDYSAARESDLGLMARHGVRACAGEITPVRRHGGSRRRRPV